MPTSSLQNTLTPPRNTSTEKPPAEAHPAEAPAPLTESTFRDRALLSRVEFITDMYLQFPDEVNMVQVAIANGTLPEAAKESALQHPLFLKLAIELLVGAKGSRIDANIWAERTFMRMKEYADSDPLRRDDELQFGFPDYLDVAFLVDAHEFGNHTRLFAVSAMTCSKEREMLEAERDEIMQTKSAVLPRMVRY